MYRAVIFDLDGTLLDTLDDLVNAVNASLCSCGFPPRTRNEVRSFVGNGVAKLMERAVPVGCAPEMIAIALARFKEIYATHCEEYTRPYPGVLALLTALRAQGIRTAIVSNKFDGAVQTLATHYFGELIEVAVGEREAEGIRRKPAPDTLIHAMHTLGVTSADTVYVGDSDVDILTARAAGVRCISVTWGFCDRDYLIRNGAECFADDAEELRNILMNMPK